MQYWFIRRKHMGRFLCLLVMSGYSMGAMSQRLSDARYLYCNKASATGLLTMGKDSITVKKHSPTRATLYSTILPGLGQAYNRKYWKIPIVYAGLGTLGYFVQHDGRQTRLRQEALNARIANDSNSSAFYRYPNLSTTILKSDRDFYRKYRDYSILGFVLFYAINIVDATVDAHLYNFNIDKPLSQRKERHLHLYTSRVGYTPTYGLTYSF